MKKSNISGWKDVFTFTLTQTLKNKAYRVSFLIMALIAVVSMPLIQYLTKGEEAGSDKLSPVEKVYIQNETSLQNLDFSSLKQDSTLKNVEFTNLTEDYDAVSKRIEESEKASVLVTIKEQSGAFMLEFSKASKGPVKDAGISALAEKMTESFHSLRLLTQGITKEQNELISAKVDTKTINLDAQGNPVETKDDTISFNEYWFIYGILFFLMMVTLMASTQVASSVVMEKSSRIVEYLLISVRPLALMVGKILAMLCAVLLQIISLMVLVFISNKVSAAMGSGSQAGIMNQYVPANIFQNLNIVNILLCLVLIALGMIFYAVLAGMAGATVSKIEELNEGMTLLTLTTLVGVYIGFGAANVLMGSGSNAFVTFAFLFPLSSPFLLPGAILVGKASLFIAAAAIILQMLLNVLLFNFVASIYETLILHNGNRIRLKDLFKLNKGGIKA
ncbi:ABC transporter permease [Anaerocolumna xylanovorans]|nr:ABC transporter permease [Anaerocolumna xylanovorans]